MKYLAILAISLLPISVGAAQDPETVFNQSCGICHNGQLHTAPKKGDKSAWAPRLDQGMDLLVERVTTGYSVMPLKVSACNVHQTITKQLSSGWLNKQPPP